MEIFSFLQGPVLIVFLYMTLVFLMAQAFKDNSIVDIAWGLGFVFTSVYVALFREGMLSSSGALVLLLVAVWGFRLSWHIFLRNRGKGEDPRYKSWREAWGKWLVLRSFFQIFMLQGFLMLIILIPVLVTLVKHEITSPLWMWLGGIVWLFGFLFESVGDRQLRTFISKPENKGRLMTKGLWKYTRHPNYFGESVMWWGIWLISLSSPLGVYGVISPILLTFLLLKVSGVSMTEKRMESHPEFTEYKKRTSVFVPWFPKQ